LLDNKDCWTAKLARQQVSFTGEKKIPLGNISKRTYLLNTDIYRNSPLNINNVKIFSMSTRQVSSGRPTNALGGSPEQPFSNQNWYYNAKITDTYAGRAWFSLPVHYRPAPGSIPKENKPESAVDILNLTSYVHVNYTYI
jgi:hypothetical protein